MPAEISSRAFRLGVAASSLALASLLLARANAWPAHEDEVVTLAVSDRPVGELLDVVLTERGGAPLHFLLAHAATAIEPGLLTLRLLSAVLAVAAVPVIALLLARLAGRTTALVATVLVCASWMTLYHGLYGRMYSLFLLTSALSLLALLRATRDSRWATWATWGVASLALAASHPYSAIVLAAEGAFALVLVAQRRLPARAPLLAFAATGVLAAPLWRASAVLADRFDLGVGSGGKLGGPTGVAAYLRDVAADFTAGWVVTLVLFGLLALAGLRSLARTRPDAAVLAACLVVVPAVALLVMRFGESAYPATRHLIFVLPVASLLVAAGLVRAAAATGPWRVHALAGGLAVLVACQLAWGWRQSPLLFAGEGPAREAARAQAEAWLAANVRPDDVLFGFEPLYEGARERGATLGRMVPRADPKLAALALRQAGKTLGHGIWVLDAGEATTPSLEIRDRSPGEEFETARFGPFMVVRTRAPEPSGARFLEDTRAVQVLAGRMGLRDAGLNYRTATVALAALERDDLSAAGRGR
ncbi:MAG: glycosyltransferase family 39 protein [Thermoleophilia bacterium]